MARQERSTPDAHGFVRIRGVVAVAGTGGNHDRDGSEGFAIRLGHIDREAIGQLEGLGLVGEPLLGHCWVLTGSAEGKRGEPQLVISL